MIKNSKIIYYPTKCRFPASPMNIYWLVWCIATIIFAEVFMTDEPMSLSNKIWLYYFCGVLPLVLAFSEKETAFYNLINDYKKPVIRTYAVNYTWMLLGIFVPMFLNYIDYGFEFMIRESILIVYWVWSIILTVIYDYKIWLLVAVSIYINCLVYMYLLIHMSEVVSQTSIIYYMFTIGIVIISTILSALIYNRQIKKILKHCEDYDL